MTSGCLHQVYVQANEMNTFKKYVDYWYVKRQL